MHVYRHRPSQAAELGSNIVCSSVLGNLPAARGCVDAMAGDIHSLPHAYPGEARPASAKVMFGHEQRKSISRGPVDRADAAVHHVLAVRTGKNIARTASTEEPGRPGLQVRGLRARALQAGAGELQRLAWHDDGEHTQPVGAEETPQPQRALPQPGLPPHPPAPPQRQPMRCRTFGRRTPGLRGGGISSGLLLCCRTALAGTRLPSYSRILAGDWADRKPPEASAKLGASANRRAMANRMTLLVLRNRKR